MTGTYRVQRLACGSCGATQRVRFLIVDGVEQTPECKACGPTTWIAFPSFNVGAIIAEERQHLGPRHPVLETGPEDYDNPIYATWAMMAEMMGAQLCDELSDCPVCAIRRRMKQ